MIQFESNLNLFTNQAKFTLDTAASVPDAQKFGAQKSVGKTF